MGSKVRLDSLVLARGLAQSRERAKALVMAGKVLVDGRVMTKAGSQVASSSEVVLKAPDIPYVGRGGVKLQGGLEAFGIDVSGGTFLDVGASTGGFTDCLLQQGAARVLAVDVGYGLLDWRLRQDPRVLCFERINARYLDQIELPFRADGAVIDVSFISLSKILPAVRGHLKVGAFVLALVKPQFEAGPADVGKSGVVRDEAVRQRTIDETIQAALRLGYRVRGDTPSSIRGAKGNLEHFLHLEYPGEASSGT